MATATKKTTFQAEVDKVTRKLRVDIYSGIRLPRERLVEQDLAKLFNVSRMVIRQALSQLDADSLVTIEPYKGAAVAEISLKRIRESYQIISLLEGYAAYLAAEHLTPKDIKTLKDLIKEQQAVNVSDVQAWQNLNKKFHRVINLKCGNSRLIELIRQNVQFTSYWFIVLSAPGRIPENIKEHIKIAEALEGKDGVEARKVIERHIITAAGYLLEHLRNNLPMGMLN